MARPCARDGCPETITRPNARYCSGACKTAAWKDRHGYKLYGRQKASRRRKSRDGLGMKVYLSESEARALLELPIPTSVRTKLESKLTSAAPMKGQTDILTALAAVAEQEVAK